MCVDCGRVLRLTTKAQRQLTRLRETFDVQLKATCGLTETGTCQSAVSDQFRELGRGALEAVMREVQAEVEGLAAAALGLRAAA